MKNVENMAQPEPSQVHFLAQWLKEYALSRALSCEEQDLELLVRGATVYREIDAYDEEVNAGQIRLLSRTLTGDACRPLNVAVLIEQHESGAWVIAPFSAYSVPALSGELLLRSDGALSLRSLCLWNSRSMADKILARSWLSDEMSDNELQNSVSVLENLQNDEKMNEELFSRTGPPIMRTDDPRRIYRRAEKAMMDEVSGIDSGIKDNRIDWCAMLKRPAPSSRKHLYVIPGKDAGSEIDFPEAEDADPLLMVAETKALYGKKAVEDASRKKGENDE